MKIGVRNSVSLIVFCLTVFFTNWSFAQSVGIAGSAITPDAQSILDIQTTAKGVLLTRMTTAQRDAIGATGSSDYGLLIFNITTSTYDYWDGSTWQQVGTGTGSASTLDEAYDNSGSGLGRTITADAGAVEINGTDGLTVNGSVGIGTTAADAQAVLDIQSTAKGILLPRMTSAQRTAISPTNNSDEGLFVYDTDTDSYWYWDATANAWNEIPNMSDLPTASDYIVNGTTEQVGADFNIDGNGTLSDLAITGGDITSAGLLKIGSTTDVRIRLDTDANGSEEFQITNNGGTTPVFTVAESGNVSAEGNADFNGNITLVGNDRGLKAANNFDIQGTSGIDIQVDSDANSANSEFRVLNDVNSEILKLQEDGGIFFSGLVALGNNILQADALGQVTRSTLDPANIISSVVAGEGLTGGGNSGAVTLDVDANNGLNVDVVNDKVQLGGALTEATIITHGANDLTLNLNSTGEFVVQDNGTDHFKVAANGDAIFGSDTYFKDTNTGGTDLVKISDAGGGGNDGRLEIFSNGTVNHTIHGDGNTIFNEQGLSRDFRIESNNQINMLIVDGSADAVGIGTATPLQELHVIGDIRVSSLSTGGNVQADGNGDLIISNDVIAGDNDYIQNQFSAAQTTANFWISNDGRIDAGLTVGDGITLDNNNSNTGTIADGALAFGNSSGEGIGSKRNAGGNQYGLDFYTNNNNRMAITSGGNVGIGTTAAVGILHVNTTQTGNAVKLHNTALANGSLVGFEFGKANSTNNMAEFRYNHVSNGDAANYVNLGLWGSANTLTVTGAGNVGIGTISPNAKLNIGDANGATIYLTREDGVTVTNDVLGSLLFDSTDDTAPSDNDASVVIRATASQDHGNSNKGGYLTFLTKDNVPNTTAATERMRINANGNVGIGTSAPAQKLHVVGTGRFSNLSGLGDRFVYADNNGDLQISGSSINASSLVDGAGAANRVTYWSDANTLTSSSEFIYGSTGNLSVINPENTTVEIRLGAVWDRPGVYSSQELQLFSDVTGIIFGDSDVERMRMTAAGSLGIGTAGPTAKLEIRASGNNNPANNGILVYNPDTGGDDDDAILTARVNGGSAGDAFFSMDISGVTGWAVGLDNSDGDKLKFGNSWSDPGTNTRMTIETGGNVGIGTTAPVAQLHIADIGTPGYKNVQIGDDSYFTDVDVLNFLGLYGSANSDRAGLRLGSDGSYIFGDGGNIGIGTTSPNATLNVIHPTSNSTPTPPTGNWAALIENRQDASDSRNGLSVATRWGSNASKVFEAASYWSGGSQAYTPILTVFGNRRVGIGNTNPQAVLHVSGSGISQTNNYGWLNTAGNTGYCGSCAASYTIQADGRIRATEFNAISDIRIKKIVGNTATSDLLEIVNQLSVTKYSYIDIIQNGNQTKEGFIAQEVEKIVPEAIKKSADYIPNIFSNSSNCNYVSETKSLTVTMETPHGLKKGDEIKLIGPANEHYASVASILNPNTFVVNEWEHEIERVFVYGKKVADFRAVDYDQLFSIGIGAIQELSKQNDKLTTKIGDLEKTVENYAHLEAELKAIKGQIDRLDTDLNARAEK